MLINTTSCHILHISAKLDSKLLNKDSYFVEVRETLSGYIIFHILYGKQRFKYSKPVKSAEFYVFIPRSERVRFDVMVS